MIQTQEERAESVARLRAMADFFEVHTDLEIPHSLRGSGKYATLTVYTSSVDEFKRWFSALPGARKDSFFPGSSLIISCDLPLVISPPSDVCKRVETGEVRKEIQKTVVKEAETVEVEVEVPVTRWECPESILAL